MLAVTDPKSCPRYHRSGPPAENAAAIPAATILHFAPPRAFIHAERQISHAARYPAKGSASPSDHAARTDATSSNVPPEQSAASPICQSAKRTGDNSAALMNCTTIRTRTAPNSGGCGNWAASGTRHAESAIAPNCRIDHIKSGPGASPGAIPFTGTAGSGGFSSRWAAGGPSPPRSDTSPCRTGCPDTGASRPPAQIRHKSAADSSAYAPCSPR